MNKKAEQQPVLPVQTVIGTMKPVTPTKTGSMKLPKKGTPNNRGAI